MTHHTDYDEVPYPRWMEEDPRTGELPDEADYVYAQESDEDWS